MSPLNIGTEAKAWSACPNCSLDLRAKSFHPKPLYDKCPFCGEDITHAWWQRTIVTVFALVLAYGIPTIVGIRGLMLLVAGLLFYFPALVLAMILAFRMIPPKYVRQREKVMTLFRRR